MNLGDCLQECNKLISGWGKRNAKFKTWYEVLSMKDELAQEGMESFVSSEPRSQYNLAKHLITAKPIPHRIPIEEVSEDELYKVPAINEALKRYWSEVFKLYSARGKQDWIKDAAGTLLAGGWSCILAYADELAVYAEHWHPATVFPEWNEYGLAQCVHCYSVSNKTLKMKAVKNKWNTSSISNLSGSTTLYDYWFMDGEAVTHGIFTPSNFLVPVAVESQFKQIPIHIATAGGLPDTVSSADDDSWTETVGQALIATNENVYKSYNKHWTYCQQLVRDTANPRWFERSAGTEQIMKPQDVFKRGMVFRGGLQDSIEPLPMPVLPVELRSDRIDMEAMLQRGGLPWALFGSTGQMSAYLMSEVASTASQVTSPFHTALVNQLTNIDNFWLDMIYENGYKPYGLDIPKLTKPVKATADYEIEIPGSAIQKATLSRMLDPNFKLSTTTVMGMLWSEIENPVSEKAKANTDAAEKNPVMVALSTIVFLKKEALRLRNARREDEANLFDKAALAMEAQLMPQGQVSTESLSAPSASRNFPKEPGMEAEPQATTEAPPIT